MASNLGVDSATVSRVVSRFRHSGGVQKQFQGHNNKCALTEPMKLIVLHLVLKRPLHEIAYNLLESTGADISIKHLQVSKEGEIHQAKA